MTVLADSRPTPHHRNIRDCALRKRNYGANRAPFPRGTALSSTLSTTKSKYLRSWRLFTANVFHASLVMLWIIAAHTILKSVRKQRVAFRASCKVGEPSLRNMVRSPYVTH